MGRMHTPGKGATPAGRTRRSGRSWAQRGLHRARGRHDPRSCPVAGISSSALPYKRTPPSWLKITANEVGPSSRPASRAGRAARGRAHLRARGVVAGERPDLQGVEEGDDA